MFEVLWPTLAEFWACQTFSLHKIRIKTYGKVAKTLYAALNRLHLGPEREEPGDEGLREMIEFWLMKRLEDALLMHDFSRELFLQWILRTTLWSWKINAAWRYFCLLCVTFDRCETHEHNIICRKIEACVARCWTSFVARKLDKLYHMFCGDRTKVELKNYWFSSAFILIPPLLQMTGADWKLNSICKSVILTAQASLRYR